MDVGAIQYPILSAEYANFSQLIVSSKGGAQPTNMGKKYKQVTKFTSCITSFGDSANKQKQINLGNDTDFDEYRIEMKSSYCTVKK